MKLEIIFEIKMNFKLFMWKNQKWKIIRQIFIKTLSIQMTHHLKQKKVLLIQTNYQSRINNFHLVVITLANSLILALLSKIIQGKNNMMKRKIYLLIMLKSITSNIDQLLQIKLSEEICVFFFIIKIYFNNQLQ